MDEENEHIIRFEIEGKPGDAVKAALAELALSIVAASQSAEDKAFDSMPIGGAIRLDSGVSPTTSSFCMGFYYDDPDDMTKTSCIVDWR